MTKPALVRADGFGRDYGPSAEPEDFSLSLPAERKLASLMAANLCSQAQDDKADQRGHERAHHDTDLGFLDQIRTIRKRQSEMGFRTVEANDERNDGNAKLRVRSETFADHYSQARLFFRSQTDIEQAHIASALVFELSKVLIPAIRTRMIGNLRNVDEDLAKRVAAGLAMDLPAANKAAKAPIDMAPSDALSIVKQGGVPMTGRKVALLFGEGSDKAEIDRIKGQVEAGGGKLFLVSPKVGPQTVKGGTLTADGQLAGSPSVLFDAVTMVLMPDQVAKLLNDSAALGWLMDAYAHCKTIGHCNGSMKLIERLGLAVDAGVVGNDKFAAVAPKRHWDREPKVRMLA